MKELDHHAWVLSTLNKHKIEPVKDLLTGQEYYHMPVIDPALEEYAKFLFDPNQYSQVSYNLDTGTVVRRTFSSPVDVMSVTRSMCK